MQVTLRHHTPLEILVDAIRESTDTHDKRDSEWVYKHYNRPSDVYVLGPRDKALIEKVIKLDHTSTLEHLVYTFRIEGLSRAALQELARHRIASMTVKSTRYTLKELKQFDADNPDEDKLLEYIVVPPDVTPVDEWKKVLALSLCPVIAAVSYGLPNDKAKYMLPESFKTNLTWTINGRSLRNFLKLRSSKAALWEMRELAWEVYRALPSDHKFIYSGCMEGEPIR